jgi:transcriptional regulator with XRE-family HTH domain
LDEEPEPAPVAAPPAVEPAGSDIRGQLQIALAIRTLRQRSGLSQRQLALRMAVPRTYVSKIENEKATPTLSSMERLARALRVSIPDLLDGGSTRSQEVRELAGDQFIAELIPFLPKLSGMQWASVLAQVRDLTTRPSRTA